MSRHTHGDQQNVRSHRNSLRWNLVVKLRRFLEPGIGCEVVLNPELSARFLQEFLDGRSGRDGLLGVEFGWSGPDSASVPQDNDRDLR